METLTKTARVKERIIEVTIELLQSGNGSAAQITTRAIAEKARVGNGLINYHFQTKENLITICVQRIIGQVVKDFKPDTASQSPSVRMADAAARVFEFLFQHHAISRISILGDWTDPSKESNTLKSQQSICRLLADSIGDEDRRIFSFVLVAAMQAAFLSGQLGDTMTGYPLNTPAARRAFIKRLVCLLLDGVDTKPVKAED